MGNGRFFTGQYRRKLSSVFFVALIALVLAAGGLAAQPGATQRAVAEIPSPVAQADDPPQPPPSPPTTTVTTGGSDTDDDGVTAEETTVIAAENLPPVQGDPNGPALPCHFGPFQPGRTQQGFVDFVGTAEEIPFPELIPGGTYDRICFTVDGTAVAEAFPFVFQGAAGFITEEIIRDAAVIPPEAAVLELSPNASQITGVETWFEQPSLTMLPEEIATAGLIEVRIRAQLLRINIDTGDGEALTCELDEFTDWTDAAGLETECGHTYWEVPDDGSNTYAMTAEYVWQYEWLRHDAAPGAWEPFVVANNTAAIVFDVEVVDLEAVIGRG